MDKLKRGVILIVVATLAVFGLYVALIHRTVEDPRIRIMLILVGLMMLFLLNLLMLRRYLLQMQRVAAMTAAAAEQARDESGAHRKTLSREQLGSVGRLASFVSGSRLGFDSNSCSICLEDFEEQQALWILPCEHIFHKACIEPWLLTQSAVCPLCKKECAPADARSSVLPVGGGASSASAAAAAAAVANGSHSPRSSSEQRLWRRRHSAGGTSLERLDEDPLPGVDGLRSSPELAGSIGSTASSVMRLPRSISETLVGPAEMMRRESGQGAPSRAVMPTATIFEEDTLPGSTNV